jgi:RhoGAP domain
MSKRKRQKGGPNIPYLVTDCIEVLEEKALKEEGILRVSGSSLQIAELMKEYEKGKRPDLNARNVHTVGGLLKRYFKDAEEPLLTFELYDDFLVSAGIQDVSQRVQRIRDLINDGLPLANQETLHKLMVFLVHVSEFADVNAMHKGNLSTMFGPQLLRKQGQDPQSMMQDMQAVFVVIHTVLDNLNDVFADWPDDQDAKPGTADGGLAASQSSPANLSRRERKRIQKGVEKAIAIWYGKTWKRDSARLARQNTGHGIAVPTDRERTAQPTASSSTAAAAPAQTINLDNQHNDHDHDDGVLDAHVESGQEGEAHGGEVHDDGKGDGYGEEDGGSNSSSSPSSSSLDDGDGDDAALDDDDDEKDEEKSASISASDDSLVQSSGNAQSLSSSSSSSEHVVDDDDESLDDSEKRRRKVQEIREGLRVAREQVDNNKEEDDDEKDVASLSDDVSKSSSASSNDSSSSSSDSLASGSEQQ